jgi:hypothetical protein
MQWRDLISIQSNTSIPSASLTAYNGEEVPEFEREQAGLEALDMTPIL